MQICNHLNFSKTTQYLLLCICLTFPFFGFSQVKVASIKQENKVLATDSVKKTVADSTKIPLPVKQKSNQIDAEIVYKAQVSIVFLGNGTGFLHGKSDITYKNINLKVDFIRIKMDSSLIFAHGTLDIIGLIVR